MNNNDSDRPDTTSLKTKTAHTLKWNIVDRLGQQVLYAVTGIVLARELSQTDFGLVGAVLIFQAFASLLVDSGFSYALIQRKNPSRLDYSTILWFNIGISIALYVLLWFLAPTIATLFANDMRIVPLARVMFLSFFLNATAIVQTNRFVKAMNVRPVAISNSVGLAAGAIAGIWLAVTGRGAWSIVWQTLVSAFVKSAMLWMWSEWRPLLRFSFKSLRSFMSVGMGMMFTSFLNTVFLNIYSFCVGNRAGLASLGYYTQSDKWSKMGISSLSQVLTSTTLPVLSEAQDDPARFCRVMRKFNRMTAYLALPALCGLAVVATPLFHTLFGTKWDASIPLFQILLARGIFTVFTGLYSNYLLALGRSRMIVRMEVVRDAVAAIALALTWQYIPLETSANPVQGITIMLWGQLAASAVAWAATLAAVKSATGMAAWRMITDTLPYVGVTALCCCAAAAITMLSLPAWALLAAATIIGAITYLGVNALFGSKIQTDAMAYLRGKL